MPEPEAISEELQELLIPHLKEALREEDWQYIPDMLEEGVFTTTEDGNTLVTPTPLFEGEPAMQFSTVSGEFVDLTDWDYIVEYVNPPSPDYSKDETICALQHYHKREYQTITDYSKVYDNRTTLTVNSITLYKYDCPSQTIYLKEDNYPVTYGNQAVDETYYYYNFDENLAGTSDESSLYEYKVTYEWKRNTIWGYDPDAEEE